MSIAVFTDAAGREWQVYQVRRTSNQAGAVSPGRELGWLAFASGVERRRLAPFPPDWSSFDAQALETLCQSADPIGPERRAVALDRRRGPRIMAGLSPETAAPEELLERQVTDELDVADPPVTLPADIEQEIRDRAAAARAHGQTVIAAMMELRPMLSVYGIEVRTPSFRAARRVFLEAFYFKAAD